MRLCRPVPVETLPASKGPQVVYRLLVQSSTEAVLAVVVIGVIGAGLFLFTGTGAGSTSANTTVPIIFDAEAAARGQLTGESTGCLQCHTVDGTPSSGPTWDGLYMSRVNLTSGESVTADDTHLRTGIVDPAAQLVEGYEAIMPGDYGETLSEQEISDLIEYIKSLG